MKVHWSVLLLLLAASIIFISRSGKVYSFSPQIFATGIEVDESVNPSGSGLKHARSAGSCPADQPSCSVTLNWPGTPFPDTNYTAVCTVSGANVVVTTGGKSTTAIAVVIGRQGTAIGNGVSFDVNCIAMHD